MGGKIAVLTALAALLVIFVANGDIGDVSTNETIEKDPLIKANEEAWSNKGNVLVNLSRYDEAAIHEGSGGGCKSKS